MSQSLSKNYIHLTFSTKYRKDSIKKDDLPHVFSYISGILEHIGCQPIIVGGITNHIHLLCNLNKNISLAKMVEEVKRSSSKWIKSQGSFYECFAWQEGYGAFSVSQSKVKVVNSYIQNQEEHHKKMSFMDELKMFLKEYEVEYNEEYV
ncbi:MAG: IS200/IS605 family transposase [Bacteroides sp.]|nr:IS200/IS605 family transposase [Bacteroides sp.]